TGDLGRYAKNGEIEYVGRIDDQVKLRGYRIEPGEIEAVLSRHPGVRQCAVTVRGTEAGNKYLVACVVDSDEKPPASAELRAYLQEKLPEYMVPSAFVKLQEMPLTANGKLDRQALPEPTRENASDVEKMPGTAVEEILAGIWCEVLKLDEVGADENFFELGGHSLLVTQVASRIREVLGVEVALRTLFENPTVRGLAGEVEVERRAGRFVEAPPIRPVSRSGELPLSFAQQRLWFIQQLEPESGTYNIPTALRLQGALNFFALQQSLREISRRHETLRTRFVGRRGQPVQVIDEPGETEVMVCDASALANTEREHQIRGVARREAIRPFDLERGLVWRVTLLRLGIEDHVLLLNMHHVVSDGWSVDLLVKEFATLYEGFRKGHRSPLEELPIQYADFAVWQREWLRGEVLEEELEYWRTQLSRVEALKLPTDHPRPAVQSY